MQMPMSYKLPQLDGVFDECHPEVSRSDKHPIWQDAFVEVKAKKVHVGSRINSGPHRGQIDRGAIEASSSKCNSTSAGKKKRTQPPVPSREPPPPPPPSSGNARKRKWIEDRDKQAELAHLMLRAMHAKEERLYHKELETYVSSSL
ncbi:unnamed protein product [Protopolystoma xenopodis]|uniref:Uncharacterized protein n=1 Tax=Protopolystoma xenopodis TaxID=117903 RepID=A0A448WMQ3_9PLAT|nr:unnamed protein product [Protopolystoma xenopodis]